MEIIIELPKDIDKLCRTCMNVMDEDQKTCVINDNSDEICKVDKMLSYIMGTDISSDDRLPKFMCNECVKQLEMSYLFKQQCESTYLNFHDFMDSAENINLKNEVLEFECPICEQYFTTQYILSKHEMLHYKNVSLLTRLEYGDNESIKQCIGNGIDEETRSLITERKKNISEDYKSQSKQVSRETVNKLTTNTMNEHSKSLKEGKLKICEVCRKEFDNDLMLQLHFINHAIITESETDPDIFDQYFLCYACGETFNTCEDLENHGLRCYSEIKDFKCVKCNQVFSNELNLLRHEKDLLHYNELLWEKLIPTVAEKNIFTCPICSEEFAAKAELSLHSVRHIIKKITCRICKRTFSCQIAHNNHLKSHPNYKHLCHLCGRWLGSRHALKTHIMGVHSATKNFTCNVCSKAFKTPSRLYIHKLTHKEDKKFICSICNYKTNYVGDFRVHNRIHTAERPYKCNFVNCKRQFKTSSHLNEHIQRHLQIKKYQCNMCLMVFGHNHTLKMHLMVHTGEKPFSCNICKVRFRRKHHLKNHMKQHVNVENQILTE